jgi:hypothetical protein
MTKTAYYLCCDFHHCTAETVILKSWSAIERRAGNGELCEILHSCPACVAMVKSDP